VPENPAVQVALAAPENPAVLAVQVVLAVPENRAVRAVRVALAAPENRAVRAVLENPAVQVVLPVLVRQQAAALVRQQAAALVRQVEVPEKEAQTRSVAISHHRAAAAVAPLLAGVGALLKPRAAGVAVA
jgi:hypothetical protein